ncbi:hypothetical protein NHX12_003550, partial [Muraenolepis orangiensis]
TSQSHAVLHLWSGMLPTIGNSCFLNLALQCLCSLPSFSGGRRPSYKDKQGLLWSIKSSLDAHKFLLLLFMKMKMEAETLQWASSCFCTCSSSGDKVFQEEEQNNLTLDLHPLLTGGLKLYFEVSELTSLIGGQGDAAGLDTPSNPKGDCVPAQAT